MSKPLFETHSLPLPDKESLLKASTHQLPSTAPSTAPPTAKIPATPAAGKEVSSEEVRSQVERLFEQMSQLLQQLVDMPPSQAVIDMPNERVLKVHQLMVLGLRETYLLYDHELARGYGRLYETWCALKTILLEGWDVIEARKAAKNCSIALIAIREIREKLTQEQKAHLQVDCWEGDGLISCINRAVKLINSKQSSGLRMLYDLLKRVLRLRMDHWRLRFVEVFFRTLSHQRYDLAIKLLDLFSYEQRDLKDTAILLLLSRAKADQINEAAQLIAELSQPERRSHGLLQLFLSCHEADSELGYRLIKKMGSRVDRNKSLLLLSSNSARKGEWEAAKLYCEEITSVLMKQKQQQLLNALYASASVPNP